MKVNIRVKSDSSIVNFEEEKVGEIFKGQIYQAEQVPNGEDYDLVVYDNFPDKYGFQVGYVDNNGKIKLMDGFELWKS